MPRGHRLAGSASVTLQQLAQEPLIWFERSLNPRLHDAVWSGFHLQGLKMNVAHQTAVESSRLALVAGGLGVTLVAAASERAIAGVDLRPIADLREKLRVYAVHAPTKATPLVTDFLVALRVDNGEQRQRPIAS
jgi:DNA-binding transcriptional LysR family regulator